MSEQADFWVYKIYADEDVLLYVGRSKAGFQRIAKHKYGQSWSKNIATIRIEHFATFAKMAARERELIEELAPPYNKALRLPYEVQPLTQEEAMVRGRLRGRAAA